MYIEYENEIYEAVKIDKGFKIPNILIQNFGYEARFNDNIVNILLNDEIIAQGKINDYFVYDTCKDSDDAVYCSFSILPGKELNKSFFIKN